MDLIRTKLSWNPFSKAQSAALGLALNLVSKTDCGGVSISKIFKVAQFST